MSDCILALGVGASGTSMVAGALHHLGVSMGHPEHMAHHPAGFPLYEDVEFYQAFQKTMPDWFYTGLIRRHQRELWGWKHTLTHKQLSTILRLLRVAGNEIKLVATHRELTASVRARRDGRCPPGRYYSQEQAEAWAIKAAKLYYCALASVDVPIHHVGFSDMRGDPDAEVRRLAELVGVDDEGRIQAAIESVIPNKEG
jgi:hypothetical protein